MVIILDWYEQLKNSGGLQALKNQIGNYGEGYMFFLACLTYLPISPLYGIKLFSVFFDFVSAVAAGEIVRFIQKERGENWRLKALLTYTTVLSLPTVILNGAYWGQCDTVYLAFGLLAIICVLRDRARLSLIMIGIALSIKMQIILILPVWVLLWYKTKKISIFDFLIIPGTYTFISIPAILAGKSLNEIFGLFGQFGSGAYGAPYQGLNNLSVFLQAQDSYIAGLFVKLATLFTIMLIGATLLLWVIKNVNISNHMVFLAVCLFYTVLTTEFMGGLHERYTLLVDVISIILFFTWKKERWYIPLILNFHSFLGYVRYCMNRWDVEINDIYMTFFMVEAWVYFVFACWLMMVLYCEFASKQDWPPEV